MKKVLFADDDRETLKVVEIILGLEGYEVRCIDNGNIMNLVIDYEPDLILLDIALGGVDGRELCRRLKDNPRTNSIPIIIISASHTIYDRGENSCGAETFIPKPFDARFLVSQVEAYIN